ncbi:Trem-like transcript 4 protein [Sciurus carolinensis]|uniref:Trem-like transcript 4 protein n=1 Tax=Sciurus carolinensis TaxID=30640 RepID=A0AA41NAS6_SCICA|nr:Trem-like transcript 4 protein [Sciurus carolinensis]
MAQEATYLIPPILLVLLASGSWAQDREFLQKLEGETIVLRCQYSHHQRSKVKSWCRKMSANWCAVLVDSYRTVPRYSIQDHHASGYFNVTVTGLRVNDSGVYYCGVSEYPRIYVLRIIQLVVSKEGKAGLQLPSPGWFLFLSPPGNWKWTFISSGLVVAVLLLGLIVLLVLYLRKAQGRDRKGEKESHDIYEDTADQKQKASGFHRQSISDEDTGAICYVSLIHLNHCGPEDSIYINTHPNPQLKPRPDPFQSVEYASIAGKRPAPSTLDALDGNLGTEAEFTRQ